MNSLNVKMQKSLFGFSQNAEIEIIHNPRVLKFKGVEIIVKNAEYPTLIGKKDIATLINRYRGTYQEYATEYNLEQIANGWMKDEIKSLQERLEELKFLQRVARSKEFLIKDLTKAEELK